MSRLPRAARLAAIAVAVVAVLAVAVIMLLQTGWGGRRLARLAEQRAAAMLDAEVSIGSISGDLATSATIRDLSITRAGMPLISADRVEVHYDIPDLLSGRIAVGEVTLFSPVIHFVEGPQGVTLLGLLPGGGSGPPRPLDVGPVTIRDGRIVIGSEVRDLEAVTIPEEVRDLDARFLLTRRHGDLVIDIEQLSGVAVNPPLTVEQLSGAIRYGGGDLVLDQLQLRTADSALTIDGSIRDLTAARSPK